MEKSVFKKRWESDKNGGGITFEDIADCAVEWGIATKPKTMEMGLVRYQVLKAAKTCDAEDFKPDDRED